MSTAVSACTFSRAGMLWFLYQCFGKNNHKLQPWIIATMIIHLLINLAMVLEIVLQCGPKPHRTSNRLNYFHLMWDGPPADGSGQCIDLNVEVMLGYFQGGKLTHYREVPSSYWLKQRSTQWQTFLLRILRRSKYGSSSSTKSDAVNPQFGKSSRNWTRQARIGEFGRQQSWQDPYWCWFLNNIFRRY